MAKIVPTIASILEKYPKIAAVERLRQGGKPRENTVQGNLRSVKRLCELGEIPLEEPLATLNRKKLTKILDSAMALGLKNVTIWKYLQALQAVVARWTKPYYDDLKWSIPVIEFPSCVKLSPRYIRPDKAILAKVKEWYGKLLLRSDSREWIVATLMMEFAMRNGDVERLRWADFREKEGATLLCYTPQKTALSSGRRVCWPVHRDIWAQLMKVREAGIPFNLRKGWEKNEARDAQLVVPCAQDVFARLNKDLRTQKLFTGSKALYELRKICIDHIYQKFGAEMASSISGDDIRTMMRYYADPSQPNIGDVRILDLL